MVNAIVSAILNWIERRLTALFLLFTRDKSDQKKNRTQAAADTAKAEALGPDSSAEEVSEAIDDELRHF